MTTAEFTARIRRSTAWHYRERARTALAAAERDIAWWRKHATEPVHWDLLREARDQEWKALHLLNYVDGMIASWAMREGFEDPDEVWPDEPPVGLDACARF